MAYLGALPASLCVVNSSDSSTSLCDRDQPRCSSPTLCNKYDDLHSGIRAYGDVAKNLLQAGDDARPHWYRVGTVEEIDEAMIDAEEVYYEGDGEEECRSDGRRSDETYDLCPHRARSGHVRQSSADEDVDETCMEPNGIAIADFDNESPYTELDLVSDRPEMLSLPDQRGLLKPKSQLTTEDSAEENSGSSNETVIGPSRRASDSSAVFQNNKSSRSIRRASSMTDLRNMQTGPVASSHLPRLHEADCDIADCSARSTYLLELNGVSQWQASPSGCDKKLQTRRSDSGVFPTQHDERSSNSTSCVTLHDSLSAEDEASSFGMDVNTSRAHVAMDKADTKLAAWCWAKDHSLLDEDGNSRWFPLAASGMPPSQLRSCSHSPRSVSESPHCPPNTERPSGPSSGKQSVLSTAKHSSVGSPPGERAIDCDEDEGEDEDYPIELRIKAALATPSRSKSHGALDEYLSVPYEQSRSVPSSPAYSSQVKAISRQLSNLAAEDVHFRTHRDSLLLLHKKELEEEEMNQQLVNSQDSVILTRFKFDAPYPSAGFASRSSSAWLHQRDLSTIPDASPPLARKHSAGKARAACAARKGDAQSPEDEQHPDEHVNCPICEVERPRWYEANVKKGRAFM